MIKMRLVLATAFITLMSNAYAIEDDAAPSDSEKNRSEVTEQGSRISTIRNYVANLKKIEKEGDVEINYVSSVLEDKSCKLILTLDVANKTTEYLVAQEISLQGVRYIFSANIRKKLSYPNGFMQANLDINNQIFKGEDQDHGEGILGPNESNRMQFDVKKLTPENCENIRNNENATKGSEEIRGYVVFSKATLKKDTVVMGDNLSGYFFGKILVK